VLSPGTGNPDIYHGSWDPGESVPTSVGAEGRCIANTRGELVAEFVRHGDLRGYFVHEALSFDDEFDLALLGCTPDVGILEGAIETATLAFPA